MPKQIPILFRNDKFTPDQKLMALSWKQPFAELMLHGKIETRTWNTNYRGWVLICASKAAYHLDQIREISGVNQMLRIRDHLSERDPHYEGNAIAIGRLIDCRPMTPQDEDLCFVKYNPNLFCHVYDSVEPIYLLPWKGTQGWKDVSCEIKNHISILNKL